MRFTWRRSWMMTSSSPYCVKTFFQNSIRLSRPSAGKSNCSAKAGAASASTATITPANLNRIRWITPWRAILSQGHLSQYRLSRDQHGIPEITVRRRIGQIELGQFVHPHSCGNRCTRHVDTFGRIAVANDLRADQLAVLALGYEFHPELARLRVVGRAIQSLNPCGNHRNTLGGRILTT